MNKKPLVLVVLALALLCAALMLPTAAFGAQPAEPNDNKPLNWATNSENTNHLFYDEAHWFYQGGHSYVVKELSDHTLVGHVMLNTMKTTDPYVPTGRVFTKELIAFDPILLRPLGFHPDGDKKVTEFVAVFYLDDDADPDLIAKIKLVDGGPKALDEGHLSFPNASFTGWEEFGSPTGMPPISNIQVHLGGLPD